MMERSIKAIATSFAAMVTCGVAITPFLASAQSTASPHTSAVRYDIAGRVVGTIAPDPDDAGPLGHPATRTTYDNRNMPVLVETGVLNQWQDENTLPEDWGADFTLHSSAEAFYDSNRRKVKNIARDSSGNIVGLSHYSYDNRGRLECTAIRMNPAAYGSIDGINACDLGPVGTGANDFGPDRITKNIYNAAGEIVQVRTAVGTNVEIASVTYEFTANGQIEHLIDANGNKAKLVYDDYDRQTHWYFPEKARAAFVDNGTVQDAINSAGSPSTTDYEQYAYDANGNRTSLRKRDGWVIEYFYDDLNRMIEKRFPDRPDLGFRAEFDVFYSYDLRGLQTSARFQSPTGAGILTAYDGFGAVKSEDNMLGGTVQSRYDKNGNRTQVTYPDGETFTHEYDGLNRHKKVLDPTGNALVTYAYNNRGLPESATRLQSAPDQSWTYDDAGRLAASTIATTSSQFDVTWNFTRNPASQILSESISNSSTYSWDGLAGVPEVQPGVQIQRAYTTNGLNQYTDVGGDAFAYDDNGNLISDGVDTFIYDHENRLVEAYHYDSVSETTYRVILLYDPMGRLMRINSYDPTLERVDFLYDGDAMVVETGANGMIQRHVHGPAAGADDPLVSYPGSSVSYDNARFLSTDARGSIVYSADRNDGNRVVNTYDEFGNPGTSNGGRFQYTGQSWLPQLEMYYYKARIYSPKLGRFLQIDPIGYEDQFNLYAYVANDPINGVDPTGLECTSPGGQTCDPVGPEIGSFSVPAKAETDQAVGFDAPGIYHETSTTISGDTTAEQHAAIVAGIINNPTLNPNDSPATRAGTKNSAGIPLLDDNVFSFVVTDSNGNLAVVNTTISGEHIFNPGYVAQGISRVNGVTSVTIVGAGNASIQAGAGAIIGEAQFGNKVQAIMSQSGASNIRRNRNSVPRRTSPHTNPITGRPYKP